MVFVFGNLARRKHLFYICKDFEKRVCFNEKMTPKIYLYVCTIQELSCRTINTYVLM